MSKTIIVTGGAGYIGAHCCKALAVAGYRPIVVDNLVYGHREAVRWGPLEQGDIADGAFVDCVLACHRPAAVIHFAAYAYVGESVTDPGKYYRNTVAGTLSLLEAMHRAGMDKLVFSSTCATYGIPTSVPIREDSPQHPINPYGRTKLMVEQMLGDFQAAHGLNAIALRYFNAAGADPEGETGERHDPETHLIPLALDAVAGTGPALTVNGDDYDTPDGTCVRDYIHVTDLADAHVRAMSRLLGGGSSDRINLGTGTGSSIREVLEAVSRIAGRGVPHSFGPRRPGDPPVLVADPSRAGKVLGWTPHHSDLETIVQTAWAWHRRSGNA